MNPQGSNLVADQLTERVEAIQTELEARHKERVDQVEEQLKKRSEAMKNQLTKKLVEGKDQVRQNLTAENEEVLARLKLAHEQEIERLNVRHQDELTELRRNEESKFASFRQASLEEQTAPDDDKRSVVKPEVQAMSTPWEPSEADARELAAKNSTVRSIIMKNIATKVKEAKDALSTQLKDEHERLMSEQLKEQQEKASIGKEQAVMMERQRNILKLSMAENKAKALQPKLEVVRKAALDTPQKPVGEVWEIAKDAKLPTPAASEPQGSSSKSQNVPRTSTFGQPTPLVAANSAILGTSQTNVPPQASTAPFSSQNFSPQRPNPFATSSADQARDIHRPNPFSTNSLDQSRGINTTNQLPSSSQPQIPAFGNQLSIPQPPASQNNLPMKPPQNTGAPHPNMGVASGVRGLQQSGLPIARGGSNRGASNTRGRGQGMGRGFPNQLDTSRGPGQQHGRDSPTSGSLSGGAKQFVPQGNKRPREDGSDGFEGFDGHQSNDSGNGKRIRGGGGGS